jgi:NAD(P)-dependent dehydrogenase (short-subunit alcohol dehydrogenase family)
VTKFLEDKAVVVTGGGNGIGRAVALLCAAEGARVVVADYGVAMDGSDPSSDVADAVVAEIRSAGGSAVAVAGDVSEFHIGAEIVSAAMDTWGRIDGAVCVAGNLRERMLFNMSEEEFDAVIAVHLKDHFNLYRHASAIMRKQEGGGSLVGFASAAFVGSTAQANYSAAKGGIISLTRSAALSLFRYGVRANCIAPVARTRMAENVPFEIETGEPTAVAPMVAYLLSDAAKEITGQTYTVVGPRISVWNQPQEIRAMFAPDGGEWTPESIAEWLPKTIKSEEHPMLGDLANRMAQMESAKKA